ncbi:hypothetical protein AB0E96_10295 [Kitasatospora sp. NPDC036755]|uniref:hypothetical protein n=1 Tax=Kitasatospora sp. NPDC036755 TaxID=3154600 RepID=UPI0034101C2E
MARRPRFAALSAGRRSEEEGGRDVLWQAPEIGLPVLMAEVDRSTVSLRGLAAKLSAYRELFRVKAKDSDPVLAGKNPADQMVHWWRRTWPGHTRPSWCQPRVVGKRGRGRPRRAAEGGEDGSARPVPRTRRAGRGHR